MIEDFEDDRFIVTTWKVILNMQMKPARSKILISGELTLCK